MAQQKQLREDIAINKDFKLLTRSYQEHAIGQINFARYSVIGSREFAQDLEEIFTNVKIAYKSKIIKKDLKNIVKKNGKDVWILITANNKLYGDLILKICQLFAGHVKMSSANKVDLVIIGKQGKNFIDLMNLKRPYKYYEVPDLNVTVEYLKEICANFLYYENVIVYYGKYNNLISQTPIISSIAGDMEEYPDQQKDAAKPNDNRPVAGIKQQFAEKPISNASIVDIKKKNYIFEPKIEDILVFFEKQILSILLNQTIQEAQLARFASRINAMEIAQNNIQTQLTKLKRKEKMFKNMEMNKKQLELLSGRTLWARR